MKPLPIAIGLTIALFLYTGTVWVLFRANKLRTWTKPISIGFGAYLVLLIGGGLAWNLTSGLPADGTRAAGFVQSAVDQVQVCDPVITDADLDPFLDELEAHSIRRLVVLTSDCTGATPPPRTVRVWACTTARPDGAPPCVDPETRRPLFGAGWHSMHDGKVSASDVYLTDRYDVGAEGRDFGALVAHELLHAMGAATDERGDDDHAIGATSVLAEVPGSSWRYLDCSPGGDAPMEWCR